MVMNQANNYLTIILGCNFFVKYTVISVITIKMCNFLALLFFVLRIIAGITEAVCVLNVITTYVRSIRSFSILYIYLLYAYNLTYVLENTNVINNIII